MNSRLRILRDELDLSRTAFGERLGVSGDVINNLERGRVEIKDYMVKLICGEFNVNEQWLRTGDGAMFSADLREMQVDQFVHDVLTGEPESFKRRLVTALVSLDETDWVVLERFFESVFQGEVNATSAVRAMEQPSLEEDTTADDWTLEHIQAEIARHWEAEKSARTETAASFFGESGTKTGTG